MPSSLFHTAIFAKVTSVLYMAGNCCRPVTPAPKRICGEVQSIAHVAVAEFIEGSTRCASLKAIDFSATGGHEVSIYNSMTCRHRTPCSTRRVHDSIIGVSKKKLEITSLWYVLRYSRFFCPGKLPDANRRVRNFHRDKSRRGTLNAHTVTDLIYNIHALNIFLSTNDFQREKYNKSEKL